MASSINASTAGGGGVIVTSDATGNLDIQSGGSTVVAVTSAGASVTGTLAATGAVTASTTLAVTGASTFTGTGKFATTIGVGNATPAASGSGITFPATQSASSDANTLDDYEEGTWTPIVSATTGSLTSYTSSGTYVKVGKNVNISARIALTNVGTASSQMVVNGLPFQSQSATSNPTMNGTVREAIATGNIYYAIISGNNTVFNIQNSTNGGPIWTNTYAYDTSIVYISAS